MSLNINKSDVELKRELEEAIFDGEKNERRVRRIFKTVFLIILIGLPLFFGYLTYQLYSSYNRVDNGLKANAVINKEYTEIRGRTGIKYSVTYTFKVDGKTYTGSSDIRSEPKNKRVVVLYDPTDPSNNKLEGSIDFYEELLIAGICAVILGVFANVISFALSSRNKVETGHQTIKEVPQPKVSVINTKPADNKFRISVQNLLSIEKDLLMLNREITGGDRPKHSPIFFQSIPKILLSKDKFTTDDVAKAATDLVSQTRLRIGKLEVPFRKPRVEFTRSLPNNEPGLIEFGDETIIRIHPDYSDDAFGLATILCHELAHFILDQNGIRKTNRAANEKLTDLFVFRCGQGLIYLQGVLDLTSQNGQTTENKLGYLSLEEMAYAHVRCASQYGLPQSSIAPEYFTGKAFETVKKSLGYLTLKNSSSNRLAEIILCPNEHILRISTEKPSSMIRCPKCKWESKIWINKTDQVAFLMNKGKKDFEAMNFEDALKTFREVQAIDKTYSLAYCWASRCLIKIGKRQEAIKELQKILSIMPEDIDAQNEMKKIIYS
jgi:hypothetical protein